MPHDRDRFIIYDIYSFSLARYKEFKEFQTRILVATNLFGRGMDIERVNIVVNYDMPEDTDTYLHRVSGSTEGGFCVDEFCFSL